MIMNHIEASLNGLGARCSLPINLDIVSVRDIFRFMIYHLKTTMSGKNLTLRKISTFLNLSCDDILSTAPPGSTSAPVLGTAYLVIGTWYLVLGTWYLVLGRWMVCSSLSGTWYLVLGTWRLVDGWSAQVCLALGTWYLVDG